MARGMPVCCNAVGCTKRTSRKEPFCVFHRRWVVKPTGEPLPTVSSAYRILHAHGRLRHMFHGEYRANIVLSFDTRDMAEDALHIIGKDRWKQVSKADGTGQDSFLLGMSLTSEEVDWFEKRAIESWGTKPGLIASLAKSVDYGEPFEIAIKIPIVPEEQETFPAMKGVVRP